MVITLNYKTRKQGCARISLWILWASAKDSFHDSQVEHWWHCWSRWWSRNGRCGIRVIIIIIIVVNIVINFVRNTETASCMKMCNEMSFPYRYWPPLRQTTYTEPFVVDGDLKCTEVKCTGYIGISVQGVEGLVYRMYRDSCKTNGKEAAKKSIYKSIFKSESTLV